MLTPIAAGCSVSQCQHRRHRCATPPLVDLCQGVAGVRSTKPSIPSGPRQPRRTWYQDNVVPGRSLHHLSTFPLFLCSLFSLIGEIKVTGGWLYFFKPYVATLSEYTMMKSLMVFVTSTFLLFVAGCHAW